jgi:predicted RNA-binding protein associated with RNAse of E/G family
MAIYRKIAYNTPKVLLNKKVVRILSLKFDAILFNLSDTDLVKTLTSQNGVVTIIKKGKVILEQNYYNYYNFHFNGIDQELIELIEEYKKKHGLYAVDVHRSHCGQSKTNFVCRV